MKNTSTRGANAQTISSHSYFLIIAVIFVGGISSAQDGDINKRGTVLPVHLDTLTGDTYALLIGISQYQTVTPLRFADKDAEMFASYLAQPRGGGLKPDRIKLLTNSLATRAGIDEAVKHFVDVHKGPQNKLILLIAGHGMFLKTEVNAKGKTVGSAPYFMTWDGHASDPKTTAYPMDDFREMIAEKALGYGRVLVFADVCHADNIAGMAGGKELQDSVNRIWVKHEGGQLGLLVASTANKFALESESFGGGHGAFSYFVVSGINGAAADAGAADVKWNDLAEYVRVQVQNFTAKQQSPRDYSTNDEILVTPDLRKDGIHLAAALPLTAENAREVRNRSVNVPPIALQPPSLPVSAAIKSFEDAIRRGILLPEETGSAATFLDGIRSQQATSPEVIESLNRRLKVAYEDRGQQVMNRYIEGDQIPQQRADFDRCARDFEESLRIDPSNVFDRSRQLFCRGRAAIFSGDFTGAEQALLESVRLDRTHAYAYNALGISRLEQISHAPNGSAATALFDSASNYFHQAMRYAPYWPYPLHNLALLLSERGDFNGSIRMYEAAMKIAPQYSYLPYNLALLHERLGDLNRAKAWYEETRRVAEKYRRLRDGVWFERAQAWNGLGTVASEQDRPSDARKYFELAIADNPRDLNARQNLARVFAKQKDYSKADQLWKANLSQDASFIASRISYADSLRDRGNIAGAIGEYTEITLEQPRYIGARKVLASLYWQQHETPAALREINVAVALAGNDLESIELRGDIQAQQGLFDLARKDWETVGRLATDRVTRIRVSDKISNRISASTQPRTTPTGK